MALSQVVQMTNNIIIRELEEYKEIDRKNKDRYKELVEEDCTALLQINNQNIKQMNQILDRLIPSDDSHTVIVENRLYSIEVIEESLMTFRVPCRNANSPAKFIVSFADNRSDIAGATTTQ